MSTIMNVVTDIVIAAQCGAACRGLEARGREGRAWSWFFGSMTCAAVAGAVRHAIPDEASHRVVALLSTDAALCVAVVAAQTATLEWRPRRHRRRLSAGFHVLLGAFAASALWRLDFMPAFFYLTAGFGWVLAVTIVAAWHERIGAREIATGLLIACVAGLVYAMRVAPAAWFDHVDLAHTMVIGALLLLYRGAMRAAAPSFEIVRTPGSSMAFIDAEEGRVS